MAGNLVEVVFGPDTAARFQVLEVDGDGPIKSFVQRNGLTFKAGRGFYECGRPETLPAHKALVLMDRQTGDYFGGTRARELLGRPGGGAARLSAATLARYAVFVQSSSANRKLARGTRFLYQTEEPGPRTPRPAAPAHDLAGLLRAVLDEPGDDTVRLVCADWYEENGQPERADFIRLQIEQALLEEAARHSASGEAAADAAGPGKRAEALLKARADGGQTWRARWLSDLPGAFRPWAVWRRGFVDLDLGADDLDAFLAGLSGVEGLPVTWRLNSRHLSVSGLPELAREAPENLPPLVGLDLSFSYCGDDYLEALLAGPWVSRLGTLLLGFTSITAAGGRVLAGCPFLSRLRVLSFDALHCDEGTSTELGAAGLAALAGSPHLTGLRELDLGQNPVRDEGLRALAGSRTLTGLTWLNLFDAQVTDEGVAALVGAPVVQNLRCLDLTGQNDLTDATLRALADSPWLGKLQTLRLGGEGYSDPDFRLRGGVDPDGGPPARFTPDGWRALCESPRLGRLSGLCLDRFESGGPLKTVEAILRRRFRSCKRGPGNYRAVWG
jgi:uncharacterized protein (TIGR02996 family)